MADLRIPPELEDVVNQIGEFIEYWGFKNVHGRIWAHVFLACEPVDAGELIDRLGVSKALVSMSIADLMEYEVLEIAGKSARGTVTYRSNSNITGVIRNVLRKRERRMLSRVSSAVKLLNSIHTSNHDQQGNDSEATPLISGERVGLLADMVNSAESCLDAMLQLGPASFAAFAEFTHVPMDPSTKQK